MTKKTVIFIILLVVTIVVLSAGGYSLYKKQTTKDPDIVSYQDPKLSEQEKEPFLKRISDSEKRLTEIAKDGSDTDKFQLVSSLASDYLSLGEFAKAKAQYEAATKLFPKEGSPWSGLAGVEARMGQYSQALAHYEKAIKFEPTNPELWRAKFDLGQAYLGYTKEQVLSEIEKALIATGNSADIISYKAKYLEANGDLEGAVKAWKQAKEKSPANADVYNAEIKAIQDKLK